MLPNALGQPMGLLPEKQIVSMYDSGPHIILFSIFAKAQEPCPRPALIHKKVFKILMILDIHFMPIIQARPLQMFVIYLKPQRVDQVKSYTDGPAQTGNIARIGRYLRLIQGHVENGVFNGKVFHIR
jgi:hypothetical protein